MAKINFTCPHCKEKATINERCDYNVSIEHPVEAMRLIAGRKKKDPVAAETNWKNEPGTKVPEENEVSRDFVDTRSFSCSACGEDLVDDEGNCIEDASHLADWLETNKMLTRDKSEPKGEFEVLDSDDREPPLE